MKRGLRNKHTFRNHTLQQTKQRHTLCKAMGRPKSRGLPFRGYLFRRRRNTAKKPWFLSPLIRLVSVGFPFKPNLPATFCWALLSAARWGELDWPPPFGRAAYPEEALIHEMDGRRVLGRQSKSETNKCTVSAALRSLGQPNPPKTGGFPYRVKRQCNNGKNRQQRRLLLQRATE